MAMAAQKDNDWCHICGERSDNLADIWYPENAEHQAKNVESIRICADCADVIGRVARGQADEVSNADGFFEWGAHRDH